MFKFIKQFKLNRILNRRKPGKLHELKCWPEYFQPVVRVEKPFEVRKNDRDYKVGDILYMREFVPQTGMYTGQHCLRRITYVLDGYDALLPGYVVLGVQPL